MPRRKKKLEEDRNSKRFRVAYFYENYLAIGSYRGVGSSCGGAVSVASSESEHQVEGRFLLNVVVREGSAVLELLSSEDESLLIGWDALLVLDLGLHVVNSVRWLDLKCDCLASECLDEDLHDFGCSLKVGCLFCFCLINIIWHPLL